MRFIVKVSSESFIKSRSVRAWHFKRLQRNIAKVLKMSGIKPHIVVYSDRIGVNCDVSEAEACLQRLAQIPGIHSILTVDAFILPGENPLDFIAKKSLDYYTNLIAGKSYAVRCKRTGKHDFTSIEVERFVGSALMLNSTGCTVKLKKPDVSVSIEVKKDKVYFIRDKKLGLGGYPLGTQGTVLSLISGGYDSSVASYKMMRRGCRVNFLFFNLGGVAHSLGAQQAALFLWQKYGCSHNATFHSVSLDTFVAEIMQLPTAALNGVLLKRAMVKVGEVIANKHKISTLVTGESLAQVSSQTLANLSVIDKATEHLILRPLVVMDKREIIDTAEQIGSAMFAQNMVEYCGVISKKPSVSAPIADIKTIESELGDKWFYDALDSAQKVDVAEIINTLNDQPQVELVRHIDEQVLIDIRATPKPIAEADLHIHFYKINQRFATLPQDKEYLLYCDKGVMSQLHAAYLHELGFDNVKVYRPE
ncbi:UNVERIFIED_CONTAM: hypothetical protein GTU68_065369 [Idotea baltica]|nr:hypothetical protein [Idotea baltica]